MIDTTPTSEGNPPHIGSRVRALPNTLHARRRVEIEVTALDEHQHGGWYVYGFRYYATGGGRRKRTTAFYPSSYFVPDTADLEGERL